MSKNKYTYYIMTIVVILLLLFWSLYSFSFNQMYSEAKIFSTDGAQPIIQILEILNYRGEELKVYFIIFFTLTSLSFLFEVYLYLFIKKNKLGLYPVYILGIMIMILIGINVNNKLYLFLLLLVATSLLVMVSITLTVKHLYMNVIDYEDGDTVHTEGPFENKEDAVEYAEKEIATFKKKINVDVFDVNSLIYSEDSTHYYVDIYLEANNSDESRWKEL